MSNPPYDANVWQLICANVTQRQQTMLATNAAMQQRITTAASAFKKHLSFALGYELFLGCGADITYDSIQDRIEATIPLPYERGIISIWRTESIRAGVEWIIESGDEHETVQEGQLANLLITLVSDYVRFDEAEVNDDH